VRGGIFGKDVGKAPACLGAITVPRGTWRQVSRMGLTRGALAIDLIEPQAHHARYHVANDAITMQHQGIQFDHGHGDLRRSKKGETMGDRIDTVKPG
jgi:hypothetical protein